MIVIFTRATMPPELQQAWLQHLRDFDTANPGCHFEAGVDGPDTSFADMIRQLQIEPGLTFSKLFARTQWKKED